MKLIEFFKGLFSRKSRTDSSMARLLAMLRMTEEKEVSCNQVFALLDQFAEAVHNNPEARSLWPQIQKHIEMCPDCREEFESLLSMLAA